jgi:hypothetical protein
MFKQAEIILTSLCLLLCAAFLILIIYRIRDIYFKKNVRIPIWKNEVDILNKVGKIIMAISLIFLTPAIIYFIFIILLPSAVIRVYAKTLFTILFSSWAILEIYLCFTVSEKLLNGSKLRRALFLFTTLLCIVIATYLFPFIPASLPFPSEAESVIIELPVKGLWMAGHAGASKLTNPHTSNLYAIDFLKLGADSRIHKGSEKVVTDFYSYNEPVYAPADGQITQIVDSLESDLMWKSDIDNPGGNYVIMDIGNEKYVYFGHLIKGSIAVKEEEIVKTGALLGFVGNSGNSTFPHLHMHIQNKSISNPEGRITFPFRFKKIYRKRLIFWKEITNGALIRNDRIKN